MQLKNLLFCSVLLAFLIQGCKNDLDINAPYKDVAVINAFLDQNDSINYIRIQKLYQNAANITTDEVAQIGDSLYFDTLNVTLTNLSNGKVYSCKRVDTIQKQPGFFSNKRSDLYAVAFPKNNGINETYRIDVLHPTSGRHFAATTGIVKDASIEFRTITVRFRISQHSFPFRFVEGTNAVLYDLIIRVFYTESLKSDPSKVETKYVDYYVSRNSPYNYGGQTVTETVRSYNFVQGIGDMVSKDDTKTRHTVGVNFITYGGSSDFQNLLNLQKPTSSIVEKKPEYSNIDKGPDKGLGIFTSRNMTVQTKMSFDSESIYTLDSALNKILKY